MPDPARTRRAYSSPRHADLRRRTRAAVVEAARRLFAVTGYHATTIETLAAEAGVAVQTVYAAFGNKRSVLMALIEATVAGDDDERSVQERARHLVEGVSDAEERLDRVLSFARSILDRSADVHAILRGAAFGDSSVRSLLDEAEQRRYTDALALVSLVAAGSMSPPDLRRAADVTFAVTAYETYGLLVARRGWSAEEWQQWAHDTIVPLVTRGCGR